MHSNYDDLLELYSQFVDGLQRRFDDFSDEIGAEKSELVYTIQIGSNAGSERRFTPRDSTVDYRDESVRWNLAIPLDSFLDRDIGILRAECNATEKTLELSNRFTEWICLKTYAYRNEFCNLQIGDIVSGPLSEELVGPTSYNRLANRFNTLLSTSGFVIWHVCKETKVDGEYELFDVAEDAEKIPKTLFLRALGSSHPQDDVTMPIDEGIASFVLTDGKTLRIDNLLDDGLVSSLTNGRSIQHKEVVEKRGWKSGVFLPLKNQHRVVGVIGAYSPRFGGFNNLDQGIVTRCAEQIAAYFVVHRAKQRNSMLVQKLTEMGTGVAAAQYSVFGSVHDAVNASLAIRNNFDFIIPTAPTKKYFDAAKDHSERLKDVLARLRSDINSPSDFPLRISKINLREFLMDKLDALSVDAHLRGIEIIFKIPTDIDLDTDEFRLSQIFFNIIGNSIRHFSYTSRRPKEVTITASERSGKVVLTIHDNGPGIDPAYLPDRVFEPFITTSEGMGLGLTIVKNFVEELRGQISVRSDWGKWTEFSLVLPTALRNL